MGAVVKISRRGIRDLMVSTEAKRLIHERAQAVTDACNAESSWPDWGGYDWADESDSIRARARIWTVKQTEAREQRLIRNLGAS